MAVSASSNRAGVFSFARPHKGKLIAFVLLSIVMAVLAVATPVLAGQVVDAIIAGAATDVVVWLAVLIAIVAVAEAGLGLLTRWLSSTIGEGVIVDKRGSRSMVLIPALDLEIQLALREDIPLDTTVSLTLNGVSLPELEAYFQVIS